MSAAAWLNHTLARPGDKGRAKRFIIIPGKRSDYFITRELLAQTRESRYKFTWARTASAGRAALLSDRFDAVLMDERLPDGSGLALIREAVTVRGRDVEDGQVEITVVDNGIGFGEQSLDKLFLPFSRLHGRGEYEGSGMGLAICRKIAERRGGSITARSQAGEGSRFIVTLPRKQARE